MQVGDDDRHATEVVRVAQYVVVRRVLLVGRKHGHLQRCVPRLDDVAGLVDVGRQSVRHRDHEREPAGAETHLECADVEQHAVADLWLADDSGKRDGWHRPVRRLDDQLDSTGTTSADVGHAPVAPADHGADTIAGVPTACEGRLTAMARNTRRMAAARDDIWAALQDGHSYARWVVGTTAIRRVDESWPRRGSRLHYTVGRGPFRHEGHTEVTSVEPGRCLELEAHAWPLGSARIEFTLYDDGDGTLVELVEHPARGTAAKLHNPVGDALLKLRNVETLRRLGVETRRRLERQTQR